MQRKANLVGCAAIFLAAIFQSAAAQDFTVDSTTDMVDKDVSDGYCVTADNTCTLRAAIQQANAYPGRDRILLPAGLYLLSVTGITDDDKSETGDLDITSDIDVIGLGASPTDLPTPTDVTLTIIDGLKQHRLIQTIGSVNVRLENLVLQHGYEALGSGGAIYAPFASSIELLQLSIRDNEALFGGGIDSSGTDTVLIRRCELLRNKAQFGGGIRADGTLTVLGSRIHDNTARVGGGIYSAASVIVDSEIVNNSVINPTNLSLGNGGGAYVKSTQLIYFFNSQVMGNKSTGQGGGLYVVGLSAELNQVRVENNRSDTDGGGLYSQAATTVTGSVFNNNSASEKGGGIALISRRSNINYSAITNNTVENNTGVAALGGAVYIGASANVNLLNSTVSGNRSVGANGTGGGLYLDWLENAEGKLFNSSAVLTHSTIANNQAASGGNLAMNAQNLGKLVFRNSILAHAVDNTNCSAEILTAVAVNGGSFNISSDDTCAAQGPSWSIVDPLLSALDASGTSLSFTHALSSLSPAINKASTLCVDKDQRLYRQELSDGFCDIGAYAVSNTISNPGAIRFAKDRSTGEFYTALEAIGSVTLLVNRLDGSDGEVSVRYRTVSGSASSADSDYVDQQGTLTFADGEVNKVLIIKVRADVYYELDESFFVELYDPQGGAQLGSAATAEIVIQDDAGRAPQFGTFRFEKSTLNVTEGQHTVMVTVQRLYYSDGPVSIDYGVSANAYNNTAINTRDYQITSGTLQFAHGETSKAFIVDIIDDTVYEGDEKFELVLSNPTGGATVDTLFDSIIVTLVDDDPRPWDVSFVYSPQASEGDGVKTVYVLVGNGTSTGALSVDYKIRGGSATPGIDGDYTMSEGTLNFALTSGSAASKTIPITLLDDTIYEGPETIVLELYNLQSALPASLVRSEAIITITDNDLPPAQPGQLGFATASVAASENTGDITLQVIRNNGAEGQVTVAYAVTGGTATATEDYVTVSGILTFAAGETLKTIPLTIIDDTAPELDETIELTLSAPSGAATLGQSKTIVQIIANDQPASIPGELSFSATELSVNESILVSVALNVVRQNGSDGPVSVGYSVTGGSATENNDFVLASGFVSFQDGETSRNIYLSIWDDFEPENNETIEITLSNPQSATLGSNKVMTVTIVDDDGGSSNKPGGSDTSGGGAVDIVWLCLGLCAVLYRRRVRSECKWRSQGVTQIQ